MANHNEKKSKRDFRQDLTDRIIDLVENGNAPWQKPWNPDKVGVGLDLPHNMATGHVYRGGNTFWLMAQGYDDPRWCTYRQAQEKGWQVRKGEKATTVEYWQFDKEEERVNPETGKTEKVRVRLEHPRCFYAKVFNASQMDNTPPYEPKQKLDWDPNEKAERILTASGVPIHYKQHDLAFYNPIADSIQLPPKSAFENPSDFYEVALHELGHATGHESRLDRDLTGGFGSEGYAREELRAQMASLYLAAEIGVPFNPERHAAYQAFWLKVLKSDRHEFFRAARDAELIADYVIGLDIQKELKQEIRNISETKIDAQTVNTPKQGVESKAKQFGKPEFDELTRLKNENVGKDAKLYMARENNSYSNYTGTIVAETGNYVLQKLSDKSVVVHEKTTLQKDVEVGENVSIIYHRGHINIVDSSQKEQEKSHLRALEQASFTQQELSQGFHKARQIIQKEFGKEVKVYDANIDKGDYQGQVVLITDHHVGQRLGANTFVLHEKERLSGEYHKGKSVQVQYNNQKALSVKLGKVQDKKKEQGISR